MQCSNAIVECIQDHFEGIEFANKHKKLSLDADTLLTITIYVAMKAELTNLWGHLKLANMFSTKMIKNSKLGYVATTFEMVLFQILETEHDQLLPKG